MAVFTHVSDQELSSFLSQYNDIGYLVKLEGIKGGIENTNYFLHTTKSIYVLTIFERLNFEQLPFYLSLMLHLSKKGICVPKPIENVDDNVLNSLCGKPAILVSKLEGISILEPAADNVKNLAINVAKMHLAGQDFILNQPNLRSLDWWHKTIPKILPFVSANIKNLLHSELAFQDKFFNSSVYNKLPKGACHCDLFRDNALFHDNELSGIFDFYFAGIDTFLFDICVIINDWCIYRDEEKLGQINISLYQAFLQSYQTIRKLTDEENKSINSMLRAAALRFWVSRLWDCYLPRDSKLLKPHDPYHFETILKKRITQ